MKNVKSIGNRQIEATCKFCDRVAILEKGDDAYLYVDENRDEWYVCVRCGAARLNSSMTTIYDIPKPEPVPASITDADQKKAWQACRFVHRALDLWGKWITELVQYGDADPGVVTRLSEGCALALEVLHECGHLKMAPSYYTCLMPAIPLFEVGWQKKCDTCDFYRALHEVCKELQGHVFFIQRKLEWPGEATDRFSFAPAAEADDVNGDEKSTQSPAPPVTTENEKVALLAGEEVPRAPTVDERYQVLIKNDPSLAGSTSRQIAALLKCSKTAVQNTETWKNLEMLRLKSQAECSKDRRRK